MNQYTPEQLNELIQLIVDNPIYLGYIVSMFLKGPSQYKLIGYCTEAKDILTNMRAFWKTKIGSNYPSKDLKKKMKIVRDIIFYVVPVRTPLYLNDPLAGPIAAWRLKNNL